MLIDKVIKDGERAALHHVLSQLHEDLAEYLLGRVREAKENGEGLTSVDAKAAFDLIRHNKIGDSRPGNPADMLNQEYPFDPEA